MKLLKQIALFILSITPGIMMATTWDEPWPDEVIKKADSFVFAKVISSDEEKGVRIEIIRSLAGHALQGEIEINDFYALHLCSVSGGHGPEFNFDSIKESYFFIRKNDVEKYCIATPTTGFDPSMDGNVFATYRHSYHKALVPVDIYEKTMTAIFNNYHGQPYDTQFINTYIEDHISLNPAGFSEEEISTFYSQHVALESIYHLRLPGFYSKIIPFLHDIPNIHNQLSAARALIAYNTPECKQELLKIVSDKSRDSFLQVLSILTLSEFRPSELIKQLQKASKRASQEGTGFGGDIMDPRICTQFPSVRDALKQLIEML